MAKRRHLKGAVGRPHKGEMCLLCGERPRTDADKGGKQGWCFECRQGYGRAYREGTADEWLKNHKRHRDNGKTQRDFARNVAIEFQQGNQ